MPADEHYIFQPRSKKRKPQRFTPMQRPGALAARPHGLAYNGGWWKKRQRPRSSPVL